MSTVYMRNEGCFFPSVETTPDIHKMLPPATFVIKHSMKTGFYFEPTDAMVLPERIYGNITKYATRILRTFADRPGVTGTLLVGEKGSGKTLLARLLSRMGVDKGYPTLIVNTPFRGDDFNTFLSNIKQPCVVLFDEFEKNYEDTNSDDPSTTRTPQTELLTLLDGVYSSKKLFVLTANDAWRINEHMKNRPGRLYYYLKFGGLDDGFIREYCEERLNNKAHIERVAVVARFCDTFNFDMLQAMVEEMNRYDESPDQVLDVLNVKADFGATETFLATVKAANGRSYTRGGKTEWALTARPASSSITVVADTLGYAGSYKDLMNVPHEILKFKPSDIKKIDARNGNFTLTNLDGVTLTLVRKQEAEEELGWKHILSI